jgi:RNA polymerase sigma factor (sigma-70 family)
MNQMLVPHVKKPNRSPLRISLLRYDFGGCHRKNCPSRPIFVMHVKASLKADSILKSVAQEQTHTLNVIGSMVAVDSAVDPQTHLCALVTRMANGDEAALAELYDRTVRCIHSLALRIVRDAGLAEEVAEDTFFQAWREAGRYQAERGRVMTWLLTICRSRALDALRRTDIAELVEDIDAFRAEDIAQFADPEQVLAQFNTCGAIQAALAQLPARERQIIALAFFRGQTHQEIAAQWQIPLGSVKTMMHRAFSQLRAQLEFAQ